MVPQWCFNATPISNTSIIWIQRFHSAGAIVIPIVFGCVFLFGLVGNVTLMYTILANKVMRSKSNVLIVSLAAGDFLLILITVPLATMLFVSNGWHYGQFMCKTFEFLQTFALSVSILTLTALSGDRLVAIVFPLYVYRSGSLRRTIIVAVAIWIVSIALAIPDFMLSGVTFNGNLNYCDSYQVKDEWKVWYMRFRTLFRFIVLFALPLIVISAFYSAIAVTLLRRSTTVNDPTRGSDTAMAKQFESRRKVANIVLGFVIVFAVCFLPRHIYLIMWNFDLVCFGFFWYVFKSVGYVLTFVYSAVNPFALYVINDQFRRHFDHYLCGRCFRSRRLRIDDRRASLSGTRRWTLTATNGNQLISTGMHDVSLEDLLDRTPNIKQSSTPDINAPDSR